MKLSDQLLNPTKKTAVVEDCCTLLDEEVAAKTGVSGFALKTAFSALKGIKPGFIAHAVEQLLPECSTALDPIWSEGVSKGDPVEHLIETRSQTSDTLLSVTDARVERARPFVRGTYQKIRGSAKKYVEEAMPRFAKVLEKHYSV